MSTEHNPANILYRFSNEPYEQQAWSSPDKEFKLVVYKVVPPPRIEQGSTILQTVAMTTSAKAGKNGAPNKN